MKNQMKNKEFYDTENIEVLHSGKKVPQKCPVCGAYLGLFIQYAQIKLY